MVFNKYIPYNPFALKWLIKTQKFKIKKYKYPHIKHHTYATRCIESEISAVVLSKLLGHADIQTTLNTYTSVFNRFTEDEIQKYLEYISKVI